MNKVTRDVYKTAKDQLDRGYKVARVARLHSLSQSTVYRIRNATSYKGKNGYILSYKPPKDKYDNIMNEYIETPPKPWWHKLKRGKNEI